MTTANDQIAIYRERYAALKASGQAPKAMPAPSPLPAPPLATCLHHETIPGGWYWTTRLRAGEALRLLTGDKPSAVSMIAWSAADPSERLNYADTIKVQWTASLGRGRVLLSDMGRVMLSIIEDSGARHDAIAGGSTAASNEARYGSIDARNTRDNFRLAAPKFGLSVRDIPPCLTFFAPVETDPAGRLVWREEKRRAGDYVDLRAEMDLLVALSNCPHPLDPAPAYDPASIDVLRFQAPAPLATDACRTATDEARRGFENNRMASL